MCLHYTSYIHSLVTNAVHSTTNKTFILNFIPNNFIKKVIKTYVNLQQMSVVAENQKQTCGYDEANNYVRPCQQL